MKKLFFGFVLLATTALSGCGFSNCFDGGCSSCCTYTSSCCSYEGWY